MGLDLVRMFVFYQQYVQILNIAFVVSISVCATLSTGSSYTSANFSMTNGTNAGSLRWPRCGVGAKYGASVSTTMRLSGTLLRNTAGNFDFFESQHTAYAKYKSRKRVEQFMCLFGCAAKAVEHTRQFVLHR